MDSIIILLKQHKPSYTQQDRKQIYSRQFQLGKEEIMIASSCYIYSLYQDQCAESNIEFGSELQK
jgi:hypothetical protein